MSLYDYALKIFLKRKELLISDKPFIYGKIDLRSADKNSGLGQSIQTQTDCSEIKLVSQ